MFPAFHLRLPRLKFVCSGAAPLSERELCGAMDRVRLAAEPRDGRDAIHGFAHKTEIHSHGVFTSHQQRRARGSTRGTGTHRHAQARTSRTSRTEPIKHRAQKYQRISVTSASQPKRQPARHGRSTGHPPKAPSGSASAPTGPQPRRWSTAGATPAMNTAGSTGPR